MISPLVTIICVYSSHVMSDTQARTFTKLKKAETCGRCISLSSTSIVVDRPAISHRLELLFSILGSSGVLI
jgi:hypothetical protein